MCPERRGTRASPSTSRDRAERGNECGQRKPARAGLVRWCWMLLDVEMVEAGGVEPPSEGTFPQDSTCVSASFFSRPTCGSGEVPPGASLSKSHNQTPRRRLIASPFNGALNPTTGRGGGGAHSLIRLRERTEYPQLRDVPSDLRVNGARHASHESLPPSKPGRPHVGIARSRDW